MKNSRISLTLPYGTLKGQTETDSPDNPDSHIHSFYMLNHSSQPLIRALVDVTHRFRAQIQAISTTATVVVVKIIQHFYIG